MPALSFQARFVDDVLAGRKLTTIRPKRKKPILLGDSLFLYTGMRHKGCRLLGRTRCVSTAHVFIHEEEVLFLEGTRMPFVAAVLVAQRDGFASWSELIAWFRATHALPFTGNLIGWHFPLEG